MSKTEDSRHRTRSRNVCLGWEYPTDSKFWVIQESVCVCVRTETYCTFLRQWMPYFHNLYTSNRPSKAQILWSAPLALQRARHAEFGHWQGCISAAQACAFLWLVIPSTYKIPFMLFTLPVFWQKTGTGKRTISFYNLVSFSSMVWLPVYPVWG